VCIYYFTNYTKNNNKTQTHKIFIFSKKYLTTRTPKLRLATAIPAAYTVNSFHNPFPGKREKQGEKIGKRVDAKMEKTESIKRKE